MKYIKLFALLLLLAGKASSQYTSGIEGSIVDPSASGVASARVVVTNEATQVVRELTTNASGYFRASDLAPGSYRVEIKFRGFQDWTETNVHVDANQVRTVYPKLAIGEQKAAAVDLRHAVALQTSQHDGVNDPPTTPT